MVRFSDSSAVQAALRDPDVQLMLQLRGGNQAAFDRLYAKYLPRVLALITHLMGHSRHTEDLAQEVFLRMYRARRSYEAGAKFSTWLFTIVNNVVSNARRSLLRRREINLSVEATGGNPLETLGRDTRYGTPERAAERKELRELVRGGVNQLSDRQRAAVSLCDFQGLTYTGVADAMGTSPDAAKSLIHRARGSLRKMLQPHARGGELF